MPQSPRTLRPEYPVRTERLLLRPLTADDADALLAYRGRADVCRYLPFEPMTREQIVERIAGQWARTELTDAGQALTLGAEVAATGELAGDVMLFWHSREHAGGEIGYVFNPALSRAAATPPRRPGPRCGSASRAWACTGSSPGWTSATRRRRGWPGGWACGRRPGWCSNELFKGEWSTELVFAMLAPEWFAGQA